MNSRLCKIAVYKGYRTETAIGYARAAVARVRDTETADGAAARRNCRVVDLYTRERRTD